MTGKSNPGNNRQRVLRSVVLKQVRESMGVCNNTARLWLRTHGPTPCKRITQKTVFYWQDEADRWLAGLQS